MGHSTVLYTCYRNHAKGVAGRTWAYIVIPLVLVSVLSGGIHFINIVSEPQKIWVPPGSKTAQQQYFFDASFDPFYRIEQLIISRVDQAAKHQVSQLAGSETLDSTALEGARDANSIDIVAESHNLRLSKGRYVSNGPMVERTLDHSVGNGSAVPAEVQSILDANVIEKDFLLAMLELQNDIATSTDTAGTGLDDICARPTGTSCAIESPLNWFRSSAAAVKAFGDPYKLQRVLACLDAPVENHRVCESEAGIPVNKDVVLGDYACSPAVPGWASNNSVCGDSCGGLAARAGMITFLVDARPSLESKAKRWETEVFLQAAQRFNDRSEYTGLKATYMAQRSVADELAIVEQQNVGVVGISYAVMFVYIVLALGRFPHPVGSRAFLGLQGILIVSFSVMAALGTVSYFGMEVTMIVTEVVPFLILAIGVDNMFIITKAMDRNRARLRQRMFASEGSLEFGLPRVAPGSRAEAIAVLVETLAEVGPSITAAALAETCAFGIGALTQIPALKQFCGVAALAVLVDFLLQMTWFAAASLYDENRRAQRGLDCCPCVTVSVDEYDYGAAVVDLPNPTESYERVFRRCGGALAEQGRRPRLQSAGNNTPLLGEEKKAAVSAAVQGGRGASYASLNGGMEGGQEQEQLDGSVAPQAAHVAAGGFPGQSAPGVLIVSEPKDLTEAVFEAMMPTDDEETTGVALGAGRGQLLVGEEPKQLDSFWAAVNQGEYVRLGIDKCYSGLLLSWPGKIITVLLWLGALGFSLWAGAQMKMGLEQELVMPTGSYMLDYFEEQASYGRAGPPAYIVMQEVNYSSPDAGEKLAYLSAALGELQGDSLSESVPNWFGQYSTWSSKTISDAISGNPDTMEDCPLPVIAGITDNATIPEAVFQFITSVPVEGACCQSDGLNCGGRFIADVKFLWDWVPARDEATRTKWNTTYRIGFDLRNQTLPDGTTQVQELRPVEIMTSRMMTQHTALSNQADFISSMQHVQSAVKHLESVLPRLDLAKVAEEHPEAFDEHGKPYKPTEAKAQGTGDAPPGAARDNIHTTWVQSAPGGAAFPYSLFYVYYEQYGYIRGIAVQSILMALAVVVLAVMVVTNPAVALWVLVMVACSVVDIVGLVWLCNPADEDVVTEGDPGGEKFGVDINAVSVVNLVAAVGLCVEFAVHTAQAFSVRGGSSDERARAALSEMGSSVFTGITVTKCVGVMVLRWAPSQMFRLYYFRMYMGIILLGAFHGLAVLPVLLSIVGQPAANASSKGGRGGGGGGGAGPHGEEGFPKGAGGVARDASGPLGVDGLQINVPGGPGDSKGQGLEGGASSSAIHASSSTGGISLPWVNGHGGAAGAAARGHREWAMTPGGVSEEASDRKHGSSSSGNSSGSDGGGSIGSGPRRGKGQGQGLSMDSPVPQG